MIPFDGEFAEKTVLPLAVAAYGADLPSVGEFKDFTEILVDKNDTNFQVVAKKAEASKSNSHITLATMTAPAGANPQATAKDIFIAEGGIAADKDAPAAIGAAAPAALAPAVPVNNRFGWVCRDEGNNRLIITLRGTQTETDWLHNLDFVAEPYLPMPGRGTVHQGFQLVYYAIRKNLLNIVDDLGKGCTEVLIVGHSLGGALATLAMPDVLNQDSMSNVSPILYNLASPRAGHDDFQSFFDSHVNVCYRIVNQWDVVPHVPPALAAYVHVGNQVTIDSGFSLDVVRNHVLTTGYAPGLAKWNAAHPVMQTAKLGRFAPASLVGVSA